MTTTTVDKVKAIADHLNAAKDSTIEMYIEDAQLEVDELKVRETYKERLVRYLAAHLATLNVRQEASRSFEGASVDYSSSDALTSGLDSTEYGKEYKRLLTKARGLRLRII